MENGRLQCGSILQAIALRLCWDGALYHRKDSGPSFMVQICGDKCSHQHVNPPFIQLLSCPPPSQRLAWDAMTELGHAESSASHGTELQALLPQFFAADSLYPGPGDQWGLSFPFNSVFNGAVKVVDYMLHLTWFLQSQFAVKALFILRI